MAYYRLYILHPYSGHIQSFEEFDAADDGAALHIASERRGERPSELWCEGRKVQRLETPPMIWSPPICEGRPQPG